RTLDNSTLAAYTTLFRSSNLSEGSHTFSVAATDAAGNTDQSPATSTWVVDTTAPETTIDSRTPASSPTNSTSVSFTFSSSEANRTRKSTLHNCSYPACTY